MKLDWQKQRKSPVQGPIPPPGNGTNERGQLLKPPSQELLKEIRLASAHASKITEDNPSILDWCQKNHPKTLQTLLSSFSQVDREWERAGESAAMSALKQHRKLLTELLRKYQFAILKHPHTR